jgi:hypothetical protein
VPTQAHYIVAIRRISLCIAGVEHIERLLMAARPPVALKVFFVDALCVGRESKD